MSSSASNTAGTIQTDEAVSNNGTVLPSKPRQLWWTILLFALTIPLSVVLFAYIYLVLVAQHPKFGRLVFSPARTIFLVTLISQLTAQLIRYLFSNVFDTLRWQLASRDTGVGTTTFLGLSQGTSIQGVFLLMGVKGKHVIWCAQRLLLPALVILVGAILKADFIFKDSYTVTHSVKVFGGLAPLNATLLPVVPTDLLCTYFSAWTASILGLSKYVTGIAPVTCKDTCSSVFLPGGVETARLLNSNLNITLLEGGVFNDTDAFLIHDAPGFQLEFFPVPEDYSFDKTADCALYGQSQGEGIYICVGSYNSSLTAAWTVCPSPLFTNQLCFTNDSWTNQFDQNTSVTISKRYATVAYDRQNLSILSVESASPPEVIKYNPLDFRSIYAKLLTLPADATPTVNATINALLFQMGFLLRLYQDDFGDDKVSPLGFLRGFLTIPIQFYTATLEYANATAARNGLGAIVDLSLPRDLETTASAAVRTPRVTTRPWTFWIFVVTAGALILWCAFIFLWILSQDTVLPNLTSLAEINVASKPALLSAAQPDLLDLQTLLRSKNLGNANTPAVIQGIKDSVLRVGAVQDPENDREVVVLAADTNSADGSSWDLRRRLAKLESRRTYS